MYTFLNVTEFLSQARDEILNIYIDNELKYNVIKIVEVLSGEMNVGKYIADEYYEKTESGLSLVNSVVKECSYSQITRLSDENIDTFRLYTRDGDDFCGDHLGEIELNPNSDLYQDFEGDFISNIDSNDSIIEEVLSKGYLCCIGVVNVTNTPIKINAYVTTQDLVCIQGSDEDVREG